MININGEEWRIALVAPLDPVLRRSDGSYTIGVCDDIVKTIFINKELSQKYIQKVLCHELTHAAMFAYDVILGHDEEELLAEVIATFGEEIIDITNMLFERIRRGRY